IHAIHPKARTTPAVRAEIARSREPTGVLARRYGVSTETIRKWRKLGAADCQDHSSRPHKLPWKATQEERAIVCALRRATGFPLDDLTFVVTHFLPHLNRDAVYRILKAEGLGRLPPASRSRKPNGTFKDYDVGFVHVDVKHLPKLRTQDGESRKRYLYVAIDRASRFVHLAVKDDETERSAVAFLKEAVQAFPFQVTHVLTDRGSCFTADGFERACEALGVAHRTTRPYTPRTNGMVERFNGRIQREVLGITVASHRDLETLLQGFNRAYNARRQRVLKGRSPERVVQERLGAVPTRANSSHDPPFNPCALPKALQVIARAKDVSHPDTRRAPQHHSCAARPQRWLSSSARAGHRPEGVVPAEPARSAGPCWWKPRSRRGRSAVRDRDRAGPRTRPRAACEYPAGPARRHAPSFLRVIVCRRQKRQSALTLTCAPCWAKRVGQARGPSAPSTRAG